MTQHPEDAQTEITAALKTHFDRSADFLNVEQICEKTALGEQTVIAALRVLHNSGRIQGPMVAEYDYPSVVTGITYY